ncbi:hypothetical protein [Pseudoxanthomonas winnipegensis]|uniref:hypothetical protein n=1 Tax=Pseudoxanthomonas winnipegensis TaxID=2480810 RepID=UPI003F87638C
MAGAGRKSPRRWRGVRHGDGVVTMAAGRHAARWIHVRPQHRLGASFDAIAGFRWRG